MTRTLLAALVTAAALSTPALASDSLARDMGVTPGVYSTIELTVLKDAIENDKRQRLRVLTEDRSPAAVPVTTPEAGETLTATGSTMGFADNAAFHVALRHAEENDDRQLARFLRAQLGL